MEQNLQQLVETIEKRHSVRTYKPVEIPAEMTDKLKNYIEEVQRPYKESVRIVFLDQVDKGKQGKLGTYGMIKGANYFLAAACKQGEYDQTILGYVLEQIVLYATSLGLGTVWIGGTYKKSSFASAMNLKEGEEIKIVVPIGYEAEKKSLVARLMGDNSKKRKEFGSIFFEQEIENPLTKEKAGKYKTALNMLRLAPSANNQQPWRVIKEGNMLHFCLVDEKGGHKIDLGIALAHFDLVMKVQGITGKFEKRSGVKCGTFSYVVSWG